MNDKKKTLRTRIILTVSVIFIAVIILAVFIEFPAESEERFICTENTDGSITIVAYKGTKAKLEIPSEIDGRTVKYIGENAFSVSDSTLREMILPDTLTEIGKNAFAYCKNLKKVTGGESVVTIGYGAFRGCDALKKVELSDKLEKIDDFAFDGCILLDTLRLPETLTYIGENAMYGCGNLRLEIVNNEYAEKYAADNNIATDFRDSNDFTLMIVAISVSATVIVFVAAYIVITRMKKRRA